MIPTAVYKDTPDSDIIDQPYTAFNQGYEAYTHVKALQDNPYEEGSDEHQSWFDGWVKAKNNKERRFIQKHQDFITGAKIFKRQWKFQGKEK